MIILTLTVILGCVQCILGSGGRGAVGPLPLDPPLTQSKYVLKSLMCLKTRTYIIAAVVALLKRKVNLMSKCTGGIQWKPPLD